MTTQHRGLVAEDVAVTTSRRPAAAGTRSTDMTTEVRGRATEEATAQTGVSAACERAARLKVGMPSGSTTFVPDEASGRDVAACGCLGAEGRASQSGGGRSGRSCRGCARHACRGCVGESRAAEAGAVGPADTAGATGAEAGTATDCRLLTDGESTRRARQPSRCRTRKAALDTSIERAPCRRLANH